MDPKAIADNFLHIVKEHYFDLHGRVGRAEFWYFVLACVVLGIAAAVISNIVFVPLNMILGLALLLPMAGMGARRLQDTGRDGRLVWLGIFPSLILQLVGLMVWGPFGALGFLTFYFTIGWLINLIALVAGIALIWFWIQPGDAGVNAYGPPPAQPIAPPNF